MSSLQQQASVTVGALVLIWRVHHAPRGKHPWPQSLPMLQGLHCITKFLQNLDSQQLGSRYLMGIVLWYDEASKTSKKQSENHSLAIRPIAQSVSCLQIRARFPSQNRESPSKTHTGNGAWQGIHLQQCLGEGRWHRLGSAWALMPSRASQVPGREPVCFDCPS